MTGSYFEKGLAGVVSDGNTSTTVPTTVSPYVGTWEREDSFTQVMVTMSSDVTGTLHLDYYDIDGTTPTGGSTPTETVIYTYGSASANQTEVDIKGLRWFRARFVPDSNGAAFRVNTYFLTAGTADEPLTDEQLRASAVPVAGPLTDAELRASAVSVTETSVGATGAAVPADATYVGVNNGGTLTGLLQPTTPSDNQPAIPIASTSGAAALHTRETALSNTAVAIKASAGKLLGYNLYNPNASLAYVHFYNVAAASVVVGTTTPLRSVALPSTATGTVGVERDFSFGVAFSTAMSWAATTTVGGSTAPVTGIVANAEYI